MLGIDHKIFPHTLQALADHPLAGGVELLEADSTSMVAVERTSAFLDGAERAVLILDSNHTHDHVSQSCGRSRPSFPWEAS